MRRKEQLKVFSEIWPRVDTTSTAGAWLLQGFIGGVNYHTEAERMKLNYLRTTIGQKEERITNLEETIRAKEAVIDELTKHNVYINRFLSSNEGHPHV